MAFWCEADRATRGVHEYIGIRKKGKLKLCLQFFLAQIREKLYEVVCEKNGKSNKKTLSSTVQSTNIM